MLQDNTMSDRSSRDTEIQAFIRSIHFSPIPTVVTDNRQHDNPIIAANSAFTDLTLYPTHEILGQNCRFLSGPENACAARIAMRSAIKDGRSILAELTNYRKDGTAFRNAVMIAPIRDASGAVAFFVGSQMASDSPMLRDFRLANAHHKVAELTPRLGQILGLMVSGFRNKQIAARLGICEQTVKMHRARLLIALGVKSSSDAIRIAVEANVHLGDYGPNNAKHAEAL